MQINWFPGHMHKARKEIKKIIQKMDVVIEILDARAPIASANPLIANFTHNLPHIKIINKSDLADKLTTEKWLKYFNSLANTLAIDTCITSSKKTKLILNQLTKTARKRDFSIRPLTAIILGIPNVGKSTIINILAGRVVAKTGNEPAITRMQQRIKLPNQILLVDTPGFLWTKLEPQSIALKLAVLGSIKNTAFNYIDINWFLVEYLLENYPNALINRYNITIDSQEVSNVIDNIAIRCGCIKSKSNIDLDKVSLRIINDFRNGKLGTISLEAPE